jgi:hypothetical protein
MHIIRLAALGLGILLAIVVGANGAIPDVQIGAATVVVNSVYGTPVWYSGIYAAIALVAPGHGCFSKRSYLDR